MGLTLIIGGPASGKTAILNRGLVSAASRQQPILVLPSGPDVRRAECDFAGEGVMGVRAVTLERWVEELWSLFGDGRRIIGPAARAAIVAELILHADLRDLEVSGKTPGFIDLVADLVKRADEPVDVMASRALGEIAELIEEYDRQLEQRGLIERVRAEAALAHDPPKLDGPVGVNRFADLAPSQERLIVGLSKKNEVSIALSWVEGRAAMEALTPLVGRLLDTGAACIATTGSEAPEPDLDRLQAALFEGGAQPPLTPALLMAEAAGGEAECALAARYARQALDAGVMPQDVAVAFRDVASRRAPLIAALRTQGVPSVFDVSLSFSKVPLGAAFLALMDACAGRGDTREKMLAFLQSPYSGASQDAVADLDARWRQRRLGESEIMRSAEDLEGARAAVHVARKLSRAALGAQSAAKWEYLATLMIQNAASVRGDRLEASLDAAAHRGLLRAVSEVASAGGQPREGDVIHALHSVRVSTAGGEQKGTVLVTEAHRLQGRRFHTVILGGLTAGEFSPTPRESLSADLLGRLGTPAGAEPALRERMLFHTIVTRPTQSLVLIRQASDERGEAIRPSVFWEDVLDVYRTDEEAAEGRVPAGLAMEKLSTADLAAAAPAFLPGRRAVREGLPRNAPRPPTRGRLADATSLQNLSEREEFSISEIETYLSCPYRWFYQRVLRRQDIDEEFGARERGSLAHEIVASFYKRWIDSGRGRISYTVLDEALAMLDETAQICRNRPGRVRTISLADEISAATAQAWARDIVADDVTFLPGFTPAHHEFTFGEAVGRPVEIAGVALRGSIDRVDVSPRGVVAVDYKSSSIVEGRTAFEGKGLLQIPLYASIAGVLLDAPVLGGLYRSFKTRAARGFWQCDEVDLGERGNDKDALDPGLISAEVARAVERMTVAVDAMRSGDIEPRPLNSRACEHCDARRVCREAI